jgi:hypothetical protein
MMNDVKSLAVWCWKHGVRDVYKLADSEDKYCEETRGLLRLKARATLPEHFFTKYLSNHDVKLEGAEDITSIKQTPAGRMEEIIKGLEEGTVKFVPLGNLYMS